VWSISEDKVDTTTRSGREEQVISVLPEWSAGVDLDLGGDGALGVTLAARALALVDWRYSVVQVAMARYCAVGFEAAASHRPPSSSSARVSRPGRR